MKAEVLETEKELQAVQTTVRLLRGFKGHSESVAETDQNERKYYKEFEGLTQVQGLIKLATDSGNNRFRMRDAKRILLGAGLIKSKKNASIILFTAIHRSGKFKRIAPGEYELILKPVSAFVISPTESLRRVQSS